MRNKWGEYSWGDTGFSCFYTKSYAHVGYVDFIMGAKHRLGKNACLDIFLVLVQAAHTVTLHTIR